MDVLTIKTQEEVQEITREFVNKVKLVFGDKLKKVMLFGSYARGDYDPESDIDILVMIDEDDKEIRKYKHDIIEIDSEINLKYDALVSPIFVPQRKFLKYQDDVPFYTNVKNEGIVLYEQRIIL